jgi:hypothetical protein
VKNIYRNAFFQLTDFLEKIEREKGIKYYLVGGILVSLYSETRTTTDIDFVVDIYSANFSINSFIEILKENNFYPIQSWNDTEILAENTQEFQYLDKQERVKLDNYIVVRNSANKYKKIGPIALERRVRIKLLGIECWATSKEDYILSKLVFGGWQDYADALGCWLRFSEMLNLDYLDKTSNELGILKEYKLLISGIDDPDEYFEELERS